MRQRKEVTAMQNDRPNTIPWPPIIYVSAAALGVVAQRILPLPWVDGAFATALQILGAILAISALLLDVTTFATFRKHKTTVMPNKGATSLITTGPFAWSRNPIYVANTALVLGAGLYFGNFWLVVSAFVAAGVTQKLAIEREEKHLAGKFGAAWESYAARVRRWV
jgi:protein-S-isoprenylcysteine O-methyltransferase Ste14